MKGLVVENQQDETSSLLKHDEKAPGCKQHFKFKLLCEIRKDFILLFSIFRLSVGCWCDAQAWLYCQM